MPDIFISPIKGKKAVPQKAEVFEKKSVNENSVLSVLEKPFEELNSVHIFSSYCENPSDISFKNQEKDEKVLLFVRRHFITNFTWITMGIILALIPILIGPLSLVFNFSLSFVYAKLILFFTAFYYLIAATYLFIKFITWYFNISFVTNLRIVDIDFSDVIYKNLASTKLSLVQDVSYTQTGVFRTFFHYGDVLIQTAGETTQFDFEAVPKPEDVVHIVGELIGKHGTV